MADRKGRLEQDSPGQTQRDRRGHRVVEEMPNGHRIVPERRYPFLKLISTVLPFLL